MTTGPLPMLGVMLALIWYFVGLVVLAPFACLRLAMSDIIARERPMRYWRSRTATIQRRRT